MSNLVNKLVVQELSTAIGSADALVLVGFPGLTVAESEDLRNKIAAKGGHFRMVRNSLARRVFAERGLEFAGDALSGNTAVAYGSIEAAVASAKILSSAEVKKAKKVRIKAAMLEGRVLGPADAASLADMPDRDTLRGQLLGCLSGPARGVASVLQGVPSGLVRVLNARADKLAGAGT